MTSCFQSIPNFHQEYSSSVRPCKASETGRNSLWNDLSDLLSPVCPTCHTFRGTTACYWASSLKGTSVLYSKFLTGVLETKVCL